MSVHTPVRCTCCGAVVAVDLLQSIESQECPFCRKVFDKSVADGVLPFHDLSFGRSAGTQSAETIHDDK